MHRDHPGRCLSARSAALLGAVLLAATACGDHPEPVTESMSVGAQGSELVVDGDVARVSVPAEVFTDGAVLEVTTNPDGVAEPGDTFTPLGPAMDVSVLDGSVPVRPDGHVELTFRFDAGEVDEPGEIIVAYHGPSRGWVLLTPTTVDLETGTATILTDHLSPWRLGYITTEQRLERFARQEAATSYVRTTAVDASQQQIEAAVATILQEGAGVRDHSVISIVANAVVANAPGGSIARALASLDAEGFQEAMLEETARTLGAMVLDEDSPVANALGHLGTSARAAGAAQGGDPHAAARSIGGALSDLLGAGTLVTVAQTAAEVVDEVVNTVWMDPALERAFEAYRDGAEGDYGYSVSPRDFDALMEQMNPGVLRQFQLRYIERYTAARGWTYDDLTAEERNELRAEAVGELRSRFDSRIERTPEIERREAAVQDMFAAFRDRGMLHVDGPNPMLPEGADIDLEGQLTRIMSFAARVQRDTGRYILATSEDYARSTGDGHLPAYIVASAALAWYTADPDERMQAYTEVLVAEGFMEPPPEIDNLALEAAELLCVAFQGFLSILAEDPNPSWNQLYHDGDERYLLWESTNEQVREMRREFTDYEWELAICEACPAYVHRDAPGFCD